MAKSPNRNYSVADADEKKLYAVTYQYQTGSGEWLADTWSLTGRSIAEALKVVDSDCNDRLDTGYCIAYEITNINVIRR